MMTGIAQALSRIIPEDPRGGCGYFFAKLPLDHPFTIACDLHDYEFEQAHLRLGFKTLDQVDAELFHRWSLIAMAQEDPKRRCELALDVCKYWPLARAFGGVLWDGDPVKNHSGESQ